jgi:hypothetical protein
MVATALVLARPVPVQVTLTIAAGNQRQRSQPSHVTRDADLMMLQLDPAFTTTEGAALGMDLDANRSGSSSDMVGRRGTIAYSTGPTQNRTRTSRSRSIEPSRCSCMPLLGLRSLSSLIDAAGPKITVHVRASKVAARRIKCRLAVG